MNSAPDTTSDFAFVLPESRDFFLGPFLLRSDLDLPELHRATGPGSLVVTIRVGDVPSSIAGATVIDDACQATSVAYLLDIPDVARFLVENGRTVTVQIYPAGTIGNITTYLLGSVFGALCHQNGMLPLHASAVLVEGKVTAFLGNSGAGKSTFAAFLGRRGYRIVSDDICLVDPGRDASDALVVIPVAIWLKLWRQSIEQIGEVARENNRIFSKDDKFRIYLESAEPATPTEASQPHLHQIVFLDRPEEDDLESSSSLKPISGAMAVARLLDTIYLGYLVEATGQLPQIFKLCALMLGQVKAYSLLTPRKWDCMDDALDLVARELLGPAGN